MSEAELKKLSEIFANRLNYFMNKYDLTQADLARRLNVSTAAVSYWCKGTKSPRMDKLDAMCEIFHCKRSDFMEIHDDEYYENEETAAIAQEIHDNRELRMLFSAAKDVSPETLKELHDVLQILKRRENND